MIPPQEGQAIRDIDMKYLKTLKERIVTYPTAHVAPLLANVQLSTGQSFDADDLEAYQYEMIGGNHSREVFQMLVKDPIYGLQKPFQFRLAAVYTGLTDKEALALGRQHNITSEVQLPSKFQDNVRLTRRIFAEIVSPKEDKLMNFNEKMRSVFMKVFCIDVSCAKKVNKII